MVHGYSGSAITHKGEGQAVRVGAHPTYNLHTLHTPCTERECVHARHTQPENERKRAVEPQREREKERGTPTPGHP